MKRSERVAMAQELRGEGLLLREIAERMGAAISTVDAYLHDPDLSRLRTRQSSYRGECEECGGPTDGHNGPGRAATLCANCIRWSNDELIAAIQLWAARHDGVPPREVDWSPAPTGFPCAAVVVRRLGWSAALKLAGFAPHQDKSPERQQWIVEQLRAGRTVSAVAAELQITPEAIHGRLRRRNLTVADVRAAA